MKYVALLRGIAPMGPNMQSAKLKWAFEEMGFNNVATIIGSGNVVFEAAKQTPATLENKIELSLPKLLGFSSSTIIWDESQISSLVKQNPFTAINTNEAKPNLTFFKNPPDKSKLPKGDNGFKVVGLVSGAFCYAVDTKIIKTPEAMLTLEREFGKGITTRTWGTVLKIAKRLGES